jgi:hypothetical protein
LKKQKQSLKRKKHLESALNRDYALGLKKY